MFYYLEMMQKRRKCLPKYYKTHPVNHGAKANEIFCARDANPIKNMGWGAKCLKILIFNAKKRRLVLARRNFFSDNAL